MKITLMIRLKKISRYLKYFRFLLRTTSLPFEILQHANGSIKVSVGGISSCVKVKYSFTPIHVFRVYALEMEIMIRVVYDMTHENVFLKQLLKLSKFYSG